MYIRIVKRPSGQAPEHIRDAWIGLTLPVAPNHSRIAEARGFGVLSIPRSRLAAWWKARFGSGQHVRGYMVDPASAVNLLKKTNPLAAAWWLTNTPRVFEPERYLVFDQECCVTEPAE
jgi:hypothetical protein